MFYRYYSIMRPVSIGAYPKDGVVEIHNYEYRTSENPIGRPAWGYIDYDRELTEKEINDYELVSFGVIENG